MSLIPNQPAIDPNYSKEYRKRTSLDYSIALRNSAETTKMVLDRAKLVHEYLYGVHPI